MSALSSVCGRECGKISHFSSCGLLHFRIYLLFIFNVLFQQESDEETRYHESLTRLLDAWVVVLRADGRILQSGSFSAPAFEVFHSYFRSVLAPPTGTRPEVGRFGSHSFSAV